MSEQALHDVVQAQLRGVSGKLYEGITTGFANAHGSWARLSEPDYRWLLSMTARARMRDFWQTTPIGPGWTIGGNVKLMGQTTLVSPNKQLTLHLFKENHKVHPGGVPSAGPSPLRQELWIQEPLLGSPVSSEAGTAVHCLLLWDCAWTQDGTPTVSARVVHTLGAARYGSRVPIDLSFKLNQTGEMFDQLAFRGAEQLDDLFPTISQEENEGHAAGQ